MKPSGIFTVLWLLAVGALPSLPAGAAGTVTSWSGSYALAGTLRATVQFDEPGQVGAIAAELLEPFAGPAPYPAAFVLLPQGDGRALAESALSFGRSPVGASYVLALVVHDGGGAPIETDLRLHFQDQGGRLMASGAATVGELTLALEVVQVGPLRGPRAGTSFLARLAASDPVAAKLEQVELSFLAPFDGPAPTASSLSLPFASFEQTFVSPSLYFVDDPVGFAQAVSYLLLDPLDDPVGESAIASVTFVRDLAPPSVGVVADRTAPVLQACAGGAEEQEGEPFVCSSAELVGLARSLAGLSELAGWRGFAAARAEAELAYRSSTEPWVGSGSEQIFRSLFTLAAEARAVRQLLLAAVEDGLGGLSAEELIELALTPGELGAAPLQAAAAEVGEAYGASFFVGGLTPVFLGTDPDVPYRYMLEIGGLTHLRVGSYAFPADELQAAVAERSPDDPPAGPIGLLMTAPGGRGRLLAHWNAIDATPQEELLSLAVVSSAVPAVVLALPSTKADAAWQALLDEHRRRLDEAREKLAGLPTRSLVNARSAHVAAAELALPGALELLAGKEGALLIGRADGQPWFSRDAAGPFVDYLAFQQPGPGRGGRGFSAVFAGEARAQGIVSSFSGYPPASLADVDRAATRALDESFVAAAEVARLRREIAGLEAVLELGAMVAREPRQLVARTF